MMIYYPPLTTPRLLPPHAQDDYEWAKGSFLIAIPLLLWYGRGELWKSFAKWFAVNQRLEDGAFLAHLLLDRDPTELLLQGESRIKSIKIRDITLAMLKTKTSTDDTEATATPQS